MMARLLCKVALVLPGLLLRLLLGLTIDMVLMLMFPLSLTELMLLLLLILLLLTLLCSTSCCCHATMSCTSFAASRGIAMSAVGTIFSTVPTSIRWGLVDKVVDMAKESADDGPLRHLLGIRR